MTADEPDLYRTAERQGGESRHETARFASGIREKKPGPAALTGPSGKATAEASLQRDFRSTAESSEECRKGPPRSTTP